MTVQNISKDNVKIRYNSKRFQYFTAPYLRTNDRSEIVLSTHKRTAYEPLALPRHLDVAE
jgi:hypothetical protein